MSTFITVALSIAVVIGALITTIAIGVHMALRRYERSKLRR